MRSAACSPAQAAGEPNPASASSFEVESARLYALRLGRPEDALAATARALTFNPANVEAIAEHVRLLERLGRGEELAAALGNLGQTLADPVRQRGRLSGAGGGPGVAARAGGARR